MFIQFDADHPHIRHFAIDEECRVFWTFKGKNQDSERMKLWKNMAPFQRKKAMRSYWRDLRSSSEALRGSVRDDQGQGRGKVGWFRPQVFHFGMSQVRTVLKGDEPYFVAKDVCDVLGYSNPRAATAQHCKAASGVVIHDGRQNRTMSVIPERDVYRLVMR